MTARFTTLLMLCLLPGLTVGTRASQEKTPQKIPDTASTSPSGAELYRQHCATCHGTDLQGNGPFPPPYREPPSLLTLSRRHGGKFPEAYVTRVLRNGVTLPAHGPAEMPVWGAEFAATNGLDEAQVALRIKKLSSYLKSLQAK
jgi:mono/diheme cytochrome c family protein